MRRAISEALFNGGNREARSGVVAFATRELSVTCVASPQRQRPGVPHLNELPEDRPSSAMPWRRDPGGAGVEKIMTGGAARAHPPRDSRQLIRTELGEVQFDSAPRRSTGRQIGTPFTWLAERIAAVALERAEPGAGGPQPSRRSPWARPQDAERACWRSCAPTSSRSKAARSSLMPCA